MKTRDIEILENDENGFDVNKIHSVFISTHCVIMFQHYLSFHIKKNECK